MAALRGVAVLVTRPERQAAPLCELLKAHGATVVRLPALQIDAVTADGGLPPPDPPFDLVIFTSANAVHFGISRVGLLRGAALAAIGPATARALQAHGLNAAVTPVGGFDSEHLLLHPRLERPDGQRILIVKGRAGRELLRERLTQRGATVTVAEVYARSRVDYSGEQLAVLAARFAGGGIDVITATSVDVVTALIDIATPALRSAFGRVHWLVPGARVAQAIRAHGIAAPLIQSDTAEDGDLVAAILRWRSSVSGA